MSNQDKKSSKILVMGLDNSGKTSIVLNLIGRTNLLNYVSLQPTLGADIIQHKIYDSNYSIWDLGGQKAYRDEYLENFQEFLNEANKLVYVIDIQDNERYDLALDYFERIIKKIEKVTEKLEITVFLHKSDPNLREIRPDINSQTINQLTDKIKKLIPDNIYFEIFKSTIYTVFDKILMQ